MGTGPQVPPTDPQQQPAQVDYGSLFGTLGPMLAMTLSQSISKQDLDALRQRVNQASQQTQQAGQQYSQAAQAPLPSSDNFYDQLAGNVASVLGRNPDYAQQAYKRAESQGNDLMTARLQNLQALRDNYDQKAKVAEQLGNTELAGEMRGKTEQAMKNMSVLIQAMKDATHVQGIQAQQTGAGERNAATNATSRANNAATTGTSRANNLTTNATRLETAGMTSAGAGGNGLDAGFKALVTHTPWGDVIDQSKVKGAVDNRALLRYAGANNVGVVSGKEYGALQDMQSSIETLKHQADQIRPYLADSGEGVPGAWVSNQAKRIGGDPILRSWNSMWANTVRTLRAQAGSGGLRINRSEIERAINWDRPNWGTDTKAILDQKMANWEIMAQNAMNPIVSRDWTSAKNGKVTVMDPAGKQSIVSVPQADMLVTKGGYARVLTKADVDPRLKAAATNRLLDELGYGGSPADTTNAQR